MAIQFVSADLDGTLLGHDASLSQFYREWNRSRGKTLLCYNTGRTVTNVLSLVSQNILPEPHFIIGSVGTEIWGADEGLPLGDFQKNLEIGWHLPRVTQVAGSLEGIRPQPPEFQNSHKSSWFLKDMDPETLAVLENRLHQAGLDARVVYSCGEFLDILPRNAGKGMALGWLVHHLGIPTPKVLVTGDSGNDLEMFLVPGVARVVVQNAEPELSKSLAHVPVYHSSQGFSAGVLEGLKYFQVLP